MSGTRVVHLLQLMNPHWQVRITQSPYIWVHSWYCAFYVFGQIHHYKCSLHLGSFIFFFFLFECGCSVLPPPSFEKTTFVSLCCFYSFVEYQLLICVSACFGTLFYWCICFFFHHYHTVLITVVLWQILKWWTSVLQLFFFSFSNYVDYFGSFAWYKFCSVCQHPLNNMLEFLLWSYWIYKTCWQKLTSWQI